MEVIILNEDKSNNKSNVRVEILNREYVIRGNEEADYILDIASFADRHLREIKDVNTSISNHRIMVLGVMNLADKLCKIQEKYETLKEEHNKIKTNHTEIFTDYNALKKKYQELEEEYNEFLDLVEEGGLD